MPPGSNDWANFATKWYFVEPGYSCTPQNDVWVIGLLSASNDTDRLRHLRFTPFTST